MIRKNCTPQLKPLCGIYQHGYISWVTIIIIIITTPLGTCKETKAGETRSQKYSKLN